MRRNRKVNIYIYVYIHCRSLYIFNIEICAELTCGTAHAMLHLGRIKFTIILFFARKISRSFSVIRVTVPFVRDLDDNRNAHLPAIRFVSTAWTTASVLLQITYLDHNFFFSLMFLGETTPTPRHRSALDHSLRFYVFLSATVDPL